MSFANFADEFPRVEIYFLGDVETQLFRSSLVCSAPLAGTRLRRIAMKLYGFGPTRSLRAIWGLKELDADFEFVPVNILAGEQRHPNFLRLNPAGKVPVLVDGDLVLTESAAIVMYLADKYRDRGLLPADLKERAQAYRWIMFAVTELEQPLWRIARHTFLYPEVNRLPADVALAREEFVAMATILDNHMDGRQFIVGDGMTIADCVTAWVIDWGNEQHLIEDCPQLRAYLKRMYARPKAPQRIVEAFASVQAGTQ
jgi:glutathione S-transferase